MNTSLFSWKMSTKKRPIEALGLFAGFYALHFLLIQYLSVNPIIDRISLPYISDLVITIIDILTLLLLLYVMRKRGFDLSDKVPQKGLKTLIVVAAIAFTLISISDFIFQYAIPSPPLGSLPFDERVATFFVEFIIAVVSGPIFEEVLFRGLLLKYVFTDRPMLGILVSSILFTLAHPSVDWTAYWYYGIPGIILGLAYNYTKSIKVPIGVHMMLNLVSHIKLKFF
ncbi:CPBP family intramembrane glutamic endopeptidase [Streptococcus cuniculi]|uniref:CPBP family intramembrane metalloprotease n=1 Tax=Streptococcus cuniculi TaxID=1432788 RepID=A0A4Y9JCS6_9STRE|nr:type II CAAX endopeptidase family protein [Streptococcus cuniculi]MBF0778531.1 CPBP family intramembrane metalloprotease [Streptococcus cuniculi]TFU97625.1 CPBP family intramembrane metalloprotease [Streptococcus cuniculi]